MFGGGSLTATQRAALERAVILSAEVEIQLTSRDKTGPLLALLALARQHAAEALADLANMDLGDRAAANKQMDVRCFQRIVEWLRDIVADGFDAELELSDAERYEINDEILGESQDAIDEEAEEGAVE